MNATKLPKPYQSMFRPACFTLSGVQSPGGVDISVSSVDGYEPLGVKRLYSSSTAVVNIAPYARRLLSPAPLCGLGAGIHAAAGRSVSCFISGGGFTSPSVTLCGGSDDAFTNYLLSAAPATVAIAPGEFDEMPVISEDWVSPLITFRHGNTSYTDSSLGQRSTEGIMAAVIDADSVCASYARLTGRPADELDGFTVRLELDQTGFAARLVTRRYLIDRSGVGRGGRRLAWVNRYGAVDYYTFPVVEEFRSSGSRTRIETSSGSRTAATASHQSVKLLSGPCDTAAAEWLSEIFSSPAVWTVDGSDCREVDVASGEVVCSPLRPSVVSLVVSPAAAPFSRKL